MALIISVTYGGQLRRVISELSGTPQSFVNAHVGDRRDQSVTVATIKRFMAAESHDEAGFQRALSVAGVPVDVYETIVQTGAVPDVHREDIASVLNVRPIDLPGYHVSGFSGLSILGANAVAPRAYPDTDDPSYMMWSLARSKQDPQLKCFRISVLKDTETAAITHGLHEYVFNYGDQPVTLMWGRGNKERLVSGDSAYVRPGIIHSFARVNYNESWPELLVVRIPGVLTDQVFAEFSTYEPKGRSRVF